ncbi:DUF262 domain-containing protein [Serratia fonticola]|uniref:GmrSD restriction endonuclease domain-containing protein n=1 Tax=Serratia fonticola TaxID=47917 RepID=UPI001377AD48|nr:DUF262 domain-containing protein [Serratia fonticola]NBJ32271.1 DUF262 domain-containing protein [Serratia fonticola]
MIKDNLDIDSKSIEELYSWYLDGSLIVNRRYQRKLVWSLNEKVSLISSIIEQYPIPLLLFVNLGDKREILDGMQRLESIMSFIEQRYPIDGRFFNLDSVALTKELKDKGIITQKEPVLDRAISTSFARYKFAISEYSSSEGDIDEVFRRINSNGKTLSRQEIRSAGSVSNFSEVVRKISTLIRGDTTHSDTISLGKVHHISICNDGLDYGVSIDNHFYVRNHILTRRSIRESADEELVANIIAYTLLDEKPTSGSSSLDSFYGIHDTPHTIELREALERNIQAKNADVIIRKYTYVYDSLEELFSEEQDNFNRHILGDDSTSQECPRYYQAVFLAFYELMINDNMIIKDREGLLGKLKNIGKSAGIINVTDGGRWAARARQDSVENLKALILRYFEVSGDGYINHNFITEINELLMNSKTEQPNYDFKQGVVKLSGDNRVDDECVKQIISTCVGINNISSSSTGYILVGVSENEGTARRVKELFGCESVAVNGFYVSGIDGEAGALNKTIDDYLMMIKGKIEASDVDESLKQQVLKDIQICSYYGKHVLKITIRSTGSICTYDEKYFIRQGSSTRDINPLDMEAVKALFGNYH